jgi:hypothetical protein
MGAKQPTFNETGDDMYVWSYFLSADSHHVVIGDGFGLNDMHVSFPAYIFVS